MAASRVGAPGRPETRFRLGGDARKVEYVAATPDDPRRWIIVSFTTVGDGDPDSAPTRLVVELFDAIMGTWRWTPVSPAEATAQQIASRA